MIRATTARRLLAYWAGRLALAEDANDIVMRLTRDSTSRIDGITVAIIGLSRASHHPVEKRSKYETQDLLEV